MNADASHAQISDSGPLLQLLRSLSVYGSLFVFATGCIVLVGWAADIDILKSIIPDRVTMKPNTALGFVFAGAILGLWHCRYRVENRLLRRKLTVLIVLGSLLAILLALLTLIEYSFPVSWNVDEVLFPHDPDAVDAAAEGKMAPNTAVSFILSGFALILLTSGAWRFAQLLSLLNFLIALLALTGHLYAVAPLYSAGSPTGMAIHTSVCFLVLSSAILLARADRGWMRQLSSSNAGGLMARRLLPLLATLPLMLGLAILVLYDTFELTPESAFALRSVFGMVIFVFVVWRNAKTLNRIDEHRQQMQERLIDSERRFRAIFNQTYQFVGLLQPDGTLLEANQSALEFGGLTPKDVIGKPVWETHWWSGSPEAQDRLKRAVADAAAGEFVRYEVQIRGAEDTVATIDFSIKPIRDGGGNVTLLIPEGREITAYKQAQEALRRSEARYRGIVEDQTELICRYRADTTIIFINEAYCRYLGVKRETLVGNSYNPLVYEADRERVLQEINSISLEHPTATIETRLVVNGRIRWTQWNNRGIFNAEGELVEYQAVGRDITELKQKEDQLERLNRELRDINALLRRREEEYRALAENIPDTITRHDRQYRYLYTNPACTQHSGIPAEIYRGRTPAQLGYREDTAEVWEASLEMVFLTGRMKVDEFEVVNKNEVKSYQTLVVPEFAPDGSVQSVLTISRDITQLRNTEKQLRRFNQELEEKVQNRTAELAAANALLKQEAESRQLVQLELWEQKRLLESFFAGSPVGMIIYNEQLQFVQLNEAIAEINGVSIEASLGRTVDQILPDLAPQIKSFFSEVLQTGEPIKNREISGETPKHPGVTRHWQASYFPLLGLDNQALGVGAVIVEISDRKRAEIELKQSEERFRRAVVEAPFPIFIHAEDGENLHMSNTVTEITGYTREEIPGIEEWTERAYGERQSLVLEGINKLYDLDRRVDEGEFEVRTKSGSTRIWNFSSAPLGRLSDGRRLVISMAADITKRKRAEVALATRLKQQATVTRLGQMALSGCPLTELFDRTTRSVAESFGVEYCKVLELLPDGESLLLRSGVGWREGLVGRATVGTDGDSQAGYTLKTHGPVIVENLTTESRFSGPPLLREHGVISGVSTIIEGRNRDQPFGILGVHSTAKQDFSEDDVNFVQAIANLLAEAIARKQTEDEINQLNQSLEQRVHERTRQLEDVNQEMEAFSYSVAHDLRAPLRSIQGFSRVLIEDYGTQLDDLGQEYINRMGASAERLDLLIEDLLAYSRLGRAEIRFGRVSLAVVIEGILSELEPELKRRGAEIIIDSSLPVVKAPRNVLKQVIANLISNAIKFVKPGVSPRVSIRADSPKVDSSDSQTRWVRLWIEDNGIGISPRHQEKIFQAFERLHGIETYPGTGIGLAIVRRGVERMGGRFGVESAEGRGSRFWIELMADQSVQ